MKHIFRMKNMKTKSISSIRINMIFIFIFMYFLPLASDCGDHHLVDPAGSVEKSWDRDLFPFNACDN